MRTFADIHCHILPYVDDGALRVQESDELVRMQESQGVRVVCCTPHLRHHMFETPDDEIRLHRHGACESYRARLHEEIARHIYDSMRLKYELNVEGEELRGESELTFANDTAQAKIGRAHV